MKKILGTRCTKDHPPIPQEKKEEKERWNWQKRRRDAEVLTTLQAEWWPVNLSSLSQVIKSNYTHLLHTSLHTHLVRTAISSVSSPQQLLPVLPSPQQVTGCVPSPQQVTGCVPSPQQVTGCVPSPQQVTGCVPSQQQQSLLVSLPNSNCH